MLHTSPPCLTVRGPVSSLGGVLAQGPRAPAASAGPASSRLTSGLRRRAPFACRPSPRERQAFLPVMSSLLLQARLPTERTAAQGRGPEGVGASLLAGAPLRGEGRSFLRAVGLVVSDGVNVAAPVPTVPRVRAHPPGVSRALGLRCECWGACGVPRIVLSVAGTRRQRCVFLSRPGGADSARLWRGRQSQ